MASILEIWGGSRTYSYGFVIVPIVLLLVWRCRDNLKGIHPTTSLLGLTCVVCSAILWFAGNIADVQLIQHVALIAILDSLVWTFLGTVVLRQLLFPLLFLFFAVPVGDSLVPLLQRWTAAFTVTALRLSGIPAVQDGFALSTPSGDWQVAEACSGIRYLLASAVIGTLVAGVAYRSWKRRIGFLLLSILLPIVANAVRAYGIVVLAYVSGNAIATGVDHIVYGFLFFSLLTAILVFAAMRSYEPEAGPKISRAEPAPSTYHFPVRMIAALVLVIAVSTSATALARFVWNRSQVTGYESLIHVPAGWSITAGDLDHEWAPDPVSVQTKTLQQYASASRQVSVCQIQYPDGRRGVELINSFNLIGRSTTWTVLGSDRRLAVIAGKQAAITEYIVAHGPRRRLVWIWYSVGDTITSDAYQLRITQAKNRVFGLPDNTTLYAVSTLFSPEPNEAANTLADFLK
jgi:exosortase A